MKPNEYFSQLPRWNDYFGSNYGRLISIKGNESSKLDGAISRGYHNYCLIKSMYLTEEGENPQRSITAQRLIAEIFLPNFWANMNVKLDTHHLDHDKLNNIWWDLGYVTKGLHNYYNYIDKIYFFTGGKFEYLNPYKIIYRTGLTFENLLLPLAKEPDKVVEDQDCRRVYIHKTEGYFIGYTLTDSA